MKIVAYGVRVGPLSLCSQVLLLPLDAQQCSTQSLSRDRRVWGLLSTTSDVGNVTQGPGGSGSPSATREWCAAHAGGLPVASGIHRPCSVSPVGVSPANALVQGLGSGGGEGGGGGLKPLPFITEVWAADMLVMAQGPEGGGGGHKKTYSISGLATPLDTPLP